MEGEGGERNTYIHTPKSGVCPLLTPHWRQEERPEEPNLPLPRLRPGPFSRLGLPPRLRLLPGLLQARPGVAKPHGTPWAMSLGRCYWVGDFPSQASGGLFWELGH